MTSPDKLLDAVLAVRAEAVVTGRCPRCGCSSEPMPGSTRQRFTHHRWCPCLDDKLGALVAQTGARLVPLPPEYRVPGKAPMIFFLLGREDRPPIDLDRINRPRPVPRQEAN